MIPQREHPTITLKLSHVWTNSSLFHTEVNQSGFLLCLDYWAKCGPPTDFKWPTAVQELLRSQQDGTWASMDPGTTPWSSLLCWPHRCFHIIWSDLKNLWTPAVCGAQKYRLVGAQLRNVSVSHLLLKLSTCFFRKYLVLAFFLY